MRATFEVFGKDHTELRSRAAEVLERLDPGCRWDIAMEAHACGTLEDRYAQWRGPS